MDNSLAILQHDLRKSLFEFLDHRSYFRNNQFSVESVRNNPWTKIRQNNDIELIRDYDETLPDDLDRYTELIEYLRTNRDKIERSLISETIVTVASKYSWNKEQVILLNSLTYRQFSSIILTQIFMGKPATVAFRESYKTMYGGIAKVKNILESTKPDYLQEILVQLLSDPVIAEYCDRLKEFDELGETILKKLRRGGYAEKLIFICHSTKDLSLVKQLEMALKQSKKDYEVFIAHESLPEGPEYAPEIIEKIKKCGKFVTVITENFLVSAYANQEAGIAHYLEKTRGYPKIHPFSLIAGDDKRLGMFQNRQIKKKDEKKIIEELEKFVKKIEGIKEQ